MDDFININRVDVDVLMKILTAQVQYWLEPETDRPSGMIIRSVINDEIKKTLKI